MAGQLGCTRDDSELGTVNCGFYGVLSRAPALTELSHFNTWPLVSELVAHSRRALEVGMWLLTHLRWWCNRVIMPIGIGIQRPLEWRDGLLDKNAVDTVVIVCRGSMPEIA